MARALTNTNAGLYLCVPCKAQGSTTYGDKRVRIGTDNPFGLTVPASGQRMVALCAEHRAAYDAARGVHRQDGDSAIVSAITQTAELSADRVNFEDMRDEIVRTMPASDMRDLLAIAKRKSSNADDAYVILFDDYADRLAQRAVRTGHTASTLPEAVRDEVRQGMRSAKVKANVDYTDTVAGYSHGRTVVSIDACNTVTVGLSGDAVTGTLGDTLADTEQGTDGWDAEVLALMDEADVVTLTGYADRDEVDGREATRHEPTLWAQGRMVPVGTASDEVKRAALAYLEAKRYLSLIG